MRVCFTVDLEPDCPPYMSDTFRGVEQGMPRLLELLAREEVPATVFSTGDVARRYPGAIAAVLAGGHELGCHGMTHRAFPELPPDEARREINDSAAILRAACPVTSFRAPYLRFPDAYVPMLEDAGFTLDSSLAKYKRAWYTRRRQTSLTRIPASTTSSVLRLPWLLREPQLRMLSDPVVLFVHPWEFVDLTHERLRYDCRFNTGDLAVERVGAVLRGFGERGATFVRMRELIAA